MAKKVWDPVRKKNVSVSDIPKTVGNPTHRITPRANMSWLGKPPTDKEAGDYEKKRAAILKRSQTEASQAALKRQWTNAKAKGATKLSWRMFVTLSDSARVGGSHVSNNGSAAFDLEKKGLVTIEYPYAKATDEGRKALAAVMNAPTERVFSDEERAILEAAIQKKYGPHLSTIYSEVQKIQSRIDDIDPANDRAVLSVMRDALDAADEIADTARRYIHDKAKMSTVHHSIPPAMGKWLRGGPLFPNDK